MEATPVGFYVSLQTPSEFQAHESSCSLSSTNTVKKMFTCDRCSGNFSSKIWLRKHMSKHINKKKYGCIECGRGFNQKESFNKHLLRHSKFPPLKCAACPGKTYTDLHGLEMHVLKFHTKEGSFKCSKCDFTTKTYHSLFSHKTLHQAKKIFSCSRCHQEFTTKAQLNQHHKINQQQNMQKFECAICKKKFLSQSHKMNHIREVHGKKTNFEIKLGEI